MFQIIFITFHLLMLISDISIVPLSTLENYYNIDTLLNNSISYSNFAYSTTYTPHFFQNTV